MIRFSDLFISIFILTTLSAYAQDESTIKLIDTDVKTFIKSYPEIQTELEAINVRINSDENFTLPEGAEVLNKVNAVVQKYGYTDYSDFITKVGTIMATYSSIEFGKESVGAQPEIEAAIKEINDNPGLTTEQKEQIKASLMQSAQALQQMSNSMASSENVAVVQPYADEIRQMLDTIGN
jgi:hypothetical protein